MSKVKSANKKVGYRQTSGRGFEFYGLHFEEAERPEQRRFVDRADADRNLHAIGEAARDAALVIVYVHHHHWEPQWELVPQWFQRFAHECVDAGAHVVVSHGVPMLQGIEIYKGAPLFYGLGNFIFHTFQPSEYTDERIWQSVVAKVEVVDGRCSQVTLHPIVLGGEAALKDGCYDARRVPHLAHGEYGQAILRRLASMSEGLGTRIALRDGVGVIDIPQANDRPTAQ